MIETTSLQLPALKPRPVMIGRDAELATLTEHLKDAENGNGHLVLVCGEPGIGKTRLVEELKKRALEHGFCVLEGTGVQAGAPYHLFSVALAKIGDEILAPEEIVRFDEIFVVNNAGLLLGHYSATEKKLDDDIVSGMLTAIQIFVRDAFEARKMTAEKKTEREKTTRTDGLAKIEFGGMRILLEHGTYTYVAAVLKGEEHPDMRVHLRTMLERIETDHAKSLKAWDGDISKFRDIEKNLKELTARDYIVRRSIDRIKLESERIRIFERATNALIKHSQDKGLLFVLEDLHSADVSSLELLRYLARNIRQYKILLCGIYRPEELTEQGKKELDEIARECGLVTINLRPLPPLDTVKMAVEVFELADITPDFANMLIENTNGNPLFVKELIQTLYEDGVLRYDETKRQWLIGSVDKIELPKRISKLISRRFDKLSEDEVRIIEFGAVIGKQFDLQVVAKCMEMEPEEVNKICSKLVKSMFLTSSKTGIYNFFHVLIREVVYSEMNPRWKRLAHKKVASALESIYKDRIDEVVYQLAHHFSNTFEYEKTIDYSIRAGNKSLGNYALTEAMKYFIHALELLDRTQWTQANIQKQLELMEKLGDIHTLRGEYELAITRLQRAIGLTENNEEKARFYRKIGLIHEHVGEYETAIHTFSNALELVGRTQLETGRIHLATASILWRRGQYDEAMHYCNDAFRIFQNFQSQEDFAQLYQIIGNIYYGQREFEKALQSYATGLRLREKLNDEYGIAMLYNNIGLIHKRKGDYENALKYHEKSLALRQKIGDQRGIAISYNNIGLIYYGLGEYPKAIEYYEKSLKIREKINDVQGMIVLLNNLEVTYEELGERERAIECHERGLRLKDKLEREERFEALEHRY